MTNDSHSILPNPMGSSLHPRISHNPQLHIALLLSFFKLHAHDSIRHSVKRCIDACNDTPDVANACTGLLWCHHNSLLGLYAPQSWQRFSRFHLARLSCRFFILAKSSPSGSTSPFQFTLQHFRSCFLKVRYQFNNIAVV